MMKINKTDLNQAVNQDIISTQQAEQLWALWQQSYANTPQFSSSHFLYYFGGILVVCTIFLFMPVNWNLTNSGTFVVASTIYTLLSYYLMQYFHNRNLYQPAGLCATFVVVLTSLMILGIQNLLGFWLDTNYSYPNCYHIIDWQQLTVECTILCMGTFMLWKHRYPILVLILSFTLWYMSMNISDWVLTFWYPNTESLETKQIVSLMFGLFMLITAIWVDFRNQSDRDYPSWLYIFGMITFWGGLTLITLHSHNELSKFIYCLINIVLFLIGIVICRSVFIIFSIFAIYCYLFNILKHNLQYPLYLIIFIIIVTNLRRLWEQNGLHLRKYLLALLPSRIQHFLRSKY